MSTTQHTQTPPKYSLEHADHIWQEWAARHAMFWSAYSRWGTVLIAVLFAPLIDKDIGTNMGGWVRIFPAAGFLVTAFGTFHIMAEAVRLRSTGKLLTAARRDIGLEWPKFSDGDWLERRFAHKRLRIDSVITFGFFVGGLALSVTEVCFLPKIVTPAAASSVQQVDVQEPAVQSR